MSEIKSLEKLRSRILLKDIILHGERMSHNDEAYERANGYANKLADEIEAEIAEKYMELPVDADGVPIHVGDMLKNAESGRYSWLKNGSKATGYLYNKNAGLLVTVEFKRETVMPSKVRHITPDQLKELVIDAMQFGYLNDLPQEMWDDKANEFAERIREMMKDGGE